MTLFAGVIYAQQGTMKNRLGQINAKNLVQAESWDENCDDIIVSSP